MLARRAAFGCLRARPALGCWGGTWPNRSVAHVALYCPRSFRPDGLHLDIDSLNVVRINAALTADQLDLHRKPWDLREKR